MLSRLCSNNFLLIQNIVSDLFVELECVGSKTIAVVVTTYPPNLSPCLLWSTTILSTRDIIHS